MPATKLFCSRSSPRSLGRGRLVHGSCVLAGWNALFSLHKDKDSSCGQYQHVILTSYAFLCCITDITIYVKDWDFFLWSKLDAAPAVVFRFFLEGMVLGRLGVGHGRPGWPGSTMACRRQSSRRYDRYVVISVQRVGDETSNRVGGFGLGW